MINPNDETTVNITLKIPNCLIVSFEDYLNRNYRLISFEHLPNTEKMYSEDKEFKKLVKLGSDYKKQRIDYIIKNNHKYNE